MPEHAEVRIMSEFINRSTDGRTFTAIHKVERGNVPHLIREGTLTVKSRSVGKQIELSAGQDTFHIFMGMTGNWAFVPTDGWSATRFTRLRLDSDDGMSLLLHGGYMGPKFSLNRPFTGQRRGPDPVSDTDAFRRGVMSGIGSRAFDKPLGEALLDQRYFNGVGAYLAAEILGRLGVSPYDTPNQMGEDGMVRVVEMTLKCINESYEHGGGELIDWKSPLGSSRIDEWIMFYGNTGSCVRRRFGTRNIWVEKRWSGDLSDHLLKKSSAAAAI